MLSKRLTIKKSTTKDLVGLQAEKSVVQVSAALKWLRMITWLKINFGQWPDHVDRPNKFLRRHVSTFLTGQNKETKLTLDSLQAQNYQLLGLVVAEPFKVAQHSFGSLWVYVICQIKAREMLQLTSWNLASKKYTDERVWLTGQMWRFRGFHGNMNDWIQPVTCLPPRSVQSTDRHKRKIMQLCLWQV